MISRRDLMTSYVVAAALPALAGGQTHKEYRWTPGALTLLNQALVKLEGASGGRLGVGLLDTGTGRVASYRGNERHALRRGDFDIAVADATQHCQ